MEKVLFVYGICEDIYQKFKEETDYLVFLEDDLDKFKKFKHLSKNNINIVYLPNIEENLLKELVWKYVYLSYEIISKPSYQSDKKQNFHKISSMLENLFLGINLTSYIYADFGNKIFENVYLNLLNSKSIKLAKNLFSKFNKIPAIIVGAGPSLDKDISMLKQVSNKAMIFAGGSTLNILSQNNVDFHISANIDHETLFDKYKPNNSYENSLFYQNQIANDNFIKTHNPKILLSDHGGFQLERWLYEKLNIIQDEFNGGWNVSTILIRLAHLLGCDPIILVGLDLSFQKNRYAKGLYRKEDENTHIETKDMFNQSVYTLKEYLIAKSWIEDFAKNNNATLINASQAGLGFDNVENINLQAATDELSQIDIKGYIHSIFGDLEEITIENKQVYSLLIEIQESLENCLSFVREFYKDKYFSMIKFHKEIAYNLLLEPIWSVFENVFKREIDHPEGLVINKILFFERIINEHLTIIQRCLCKKDMS